MSDYVEPGYTEAGYFGPSGSLAMFQLGEEVINFDQPPLRVPTDLTLLQPQFASAADVAFAFDPLAEEEILLLRWPRLFRYYRNRIVAFFTDTANGMAGVFDYRDKDGVTRQVRFAATALPEIKEVAHDRFEVAVPLLVVA